MKRQKNDRAGAEAIAEAALRPTMRFVAVKSAETQGRAVAFGQQDGPDGHPPPSDSRGHERNPLGGSQGRQYKPLAGCAGGAQAQDGRGSRAGEQDSAHDLGYDNEERGLSDGVI